MTRARKHKQARIYTVTVTGKGVVFPSGFFAAVMAVTGRNNREGAETQLQLRIELGEEKE